MSPRGDFNQFQKKACLLNLLRVFVFEIHCIIISLLKVPLFSANVLSIGGDNVTSFCQMPRVSRQFWTMGDACNVWETDKISMSVLLSIAFYFSFH